MFYLDIYNHLFSNQYLLGRHIVNDPDHQIKLIRCWVRSVMIKKCDYSDSVPVTFRIILNHLPGVSVDTKFANTLHTVIIIESLRFRICLKITLSDIIRFIESLTSVVIFATIMDADDSKYIYTFKLYNLSSPRFFLLIK